MFDVFGGGGPRMAETLDERDDMLQWQVLGCIPAFISLTVTGLVC